MRWISGGLRTAAVIGVGLALFGLGFLLGIGQSPALAEGNFQGDRDALFVPFWQAWDLIHQSYLNPPDDNTLMEGALSGMVAALGDEYSYYMDPATFALKSMDLQGEFDGIGAIVRRNGETGELVVTDLLPDSPAQLAGLLIGDSIVTIDSLDTAAMTQTEVMSHVRGEAGTVVILEISRAGEADLLQLRMMRAHVQQDSIEARLLDNGLVYIRLTLFGSRTPEELQEALHTLDVENRPGLVLDLRGNPGGYLSTALEVASEFLSSGVILTERLRNGEQVYEAHGYPTAPTVPLAVLVDENSASASELVAGALQDHHRAIVVGTRTFGKGSVQNWQRLSNDGGIRLTVALWYTPDNHSIHGIGLTPDIVASNGAGGEDYPLAAAVQALTRLDVAAP